MLFIVSGRNKVCSIYVFSCLLHFMKSMSWNKHYFFLLWCHKGHGHLSHFTETTIVRCLIGPLGPPCGHYVFVSFQCMTLISKYFQVEAVNRGLNTPSPGDQQNSTLSFLSFGMKSSHRELRLCLTSKLPHPCVYSFSAIFIVSLAFILSFRDASFSSSCKWEKKQEGLLHSPKTSACLSNKPSKRKGRKLKIMRYFFGKCQIFSVWGRLTALQLLPQCPKAAVSTCSWVCWLLRWLLLWDPGNEWNDILLCTLLSLVLSLCFYLDGGGHCVRDRQLRSARGDGRRWRSAHTCGCVRACVCVSVCVRERVLKNKHGHAATAAALYFFVRYVKPQSGFIWMLRVKKHHVFCCFADIRF